MKKIGIVGGLAWPSTVEYYSELCRRAKRCDASGGLEISVESLDLAKSVSYFGVDGDEKSWSQFDEYHRRALQRLEAGGAAVACVASNTPHHRFESIVKGIGIPVISILDAVASECTQMGLRHVLLLGTALTMNSQTFRSGFSKYGIAATGPVDTHVQAAIVELIADLQRNRREGAADRLHRLTASAFGRHPGERPAVPCVHGTSARVRGYEKARDVRARWHRVRER